MKPRVIFLLPDTNATDARATISSIVDSTLREQFEFSLMPEWSAQRTSPHAIVFSDPIKWSSLPLLLRLRKARGHGRLIVVDHCHSAAYEHFNVPLPTRLRMRLRIGYALADRVVAVSRGQQEWMQHHHLVRSRKIVLIRPSANLDPLLALPPRESGKPIVLGAMGVFNQQHGFDVLLQAMHELAPGRARLLLAGFGPDEEKLRTLAATLKNVEFCGEIRDSAAFFDRCDAVVVPSRWEPWGMTCLEARAAGKPLIVSRVDGLTEQMDHCGLLVQPEDVEALFNALGTFAAQTPATLSKWGDHARKSAAGTYERFVRHWKEILGTP